MNINLIGVPLFLGCDKPGVEKGPNNLRENNILQIFKNHNHEVYDLGNLYVPSFEIDDKFCDHNNMKYLSQIVGVNTNLAHLVYSSLKSGSFPLVLGGDHSLGLGSLSGVSKYFGSDLGVIWFDAHGDINTFETSPTGNVHGMPLAAAMGLGHEHLTDLYYQGIKVKPENVFIVGARDLDEGELKLIEDFSLNLWTTNDIKEKGIKKICEELKSAVKKSGVRNIHLSFDIDSLDSTLVPGTGTPVGNGLNYYEVENILKEILSLKMVKSMDFVEFNPVIDKNDLTLNNCIKLLNFIAENLR
ncbi:arginase [Clostridium polynesiense]|uniref:arginase n=1 Tax=Clostridium polynesiense TaxID=1325933 RepID=UPI00058C1EA3|nr:arginase [Clostridium polynesiense]